MNKDVVSVQEVSPGYEFVAENPVVPLGYKQTDVGVTPEDWEALELEQVLTLQRGYDLPHRLRKAGNVPIISSSGASGLHDVEKIVPPGVVTGRYGTIGEVFYVNQAYWPLNTTLYVKDFKGNDPRFIYYLLRTVDFVSHSGKSGVPGVNRNDVHKEQIALPPIHEQRAIATALSDMDALLEELDRLIAKKRDIKQAAMQQLLTGETRLPGFEGAWERVALGDVAAFYKGKGLPKSAINTFGEQPCIHYGELFTQYGVKIEKIISRTDECFDSFLSVANDVLMPTSDVTPSGLAKASCVSANNVILGGDILVIRTDPDIVNGVFLSSIIRKDADQVLRLVTGTTVYHLYGSDMQKFIFVIPSIAEQNAIVDTLADIDTEIQALEQRRSKTAELKQGMMQELLTGRTRLV